jgi:hypothetical protein
MADFPALVPASRPLTPGSWGGASVSALSGGASAVRRSSAEIGRRLSLRFESITEAQFLQIVAHYQGQRSGFDGFAFTIATVPAAYTPNGHQWLYAGPPQVTDQHVDVFDVEVECRSEPRGVFRAPGVAFVRQPALAAGGITTAISGATLTPTLSLTAGSPLVVIPGGTFARTPSLAAGAPLVPISGGTFTLTPSLAAGSVPVTDPDFSSVSLLLHMEGANNSTTFTDSGPLGLTVTRSASAGVITTSQSAIGSSSFNVNGDHLNLPTNSALTLSGDFTIEWRARHTSLSGKQQYFLNFTGTNVQIAYQGGLFFFPPNVARTLSMTADTWAALAVTRSGSTLYWFKDGTLLGSVTDSTSYDLSGGSIARIGSENMLGFLDEIRITKGVCRYTANYTVATAPFPEN